MANDRIRVFRYESENGIERLKKAIDEADAIIIGAGAGLSTSAGFIYSGERFERYFGDFIAKYQLTDMYTAGFYPYETPEEFWAFWSRYIYINRYMDAPKDTYNKLYDLVKDKDYFVLTTNVDHCFQKAGFNKERLFYTQGDYGLFQCSEPCHQATYDNEDIINLMVAKQADMRIPSDLIPHCPVCGKPMTMNLRSDDTFVEDEGWYAARGRYYDFFAKHQGQKLLLLELGVGANTPVIIKYPFWQMTAQLENATYACINYNEAIVPENIIEKAICINGDIDDVLNTLKAQESV